MVDNNTQKFSNRHWFSGVVTKINLAKCCDAFIDIGVGLPDSEAWIMAESGFPPERIIGFEPHKDRFDNLKNAYPGTLVKCAVSAQECILRGMTGNDFVAKTMTTNDISLNKEYSYSSTEVEAVSIDSIVAQNQLKSACVWADVEGSEYEIVLGSVRSLMAKFINTFFLELRKNQTTYHIVSLLSRFGYYPVGSSGVATFGNIPVESLGGGSPISLLHLTDDEHSDVVFQYVEDMKLENFSFRIIDRN